MRRPVKLTLFALAALALVGAAALWRTLRYGFSAHDEPTRMEAWMARAARRWAAPADLRGASNPLALTPQILAEARAHWADHCASCHGNDGKGRTEIGEHLYPRAPDMTLRTTQSLSDGELFAIIENGIRLTGMPGWGNGTAESGYESWSLVHFIRHLPELTPEEIAEMEALNPKTPEEWEEMRAEEEFLSGEGRSATAEPSADHTATTEHRH
ncbi:MAG TPA: c-type cytochrome [Thermoanaerobaculia bacterium]|jgi:cytochrome c553|nr:c-type cytochrome [Thermoanaerobaculia bacterium]